MTKVKLLAAFATLFLGSLSASAINPPTKIGATPEAGKTYYLYNIGAGLYMNHGSSWSTHVTVDGAGAEITLGGSEGAYTIHQLGIAANKYQTEDGWSDNTSAGKFSFDAAEAEGYTNVFYLHASGGNYYYWAGGVGQWGDEAITGAAPDTFTDAYKWILVPAADRTALTAGNDATYLIKNPDFAGSAINWGQACTTNWTGDGVTNYAAEGEQATYYSGQFAEKWTASPGALADISHYQTISGIPAGKYTLGVTAQAIQQGDNSAGTGAYIYAGEDKAELGLYGSYSVDFRATGADIEVGVKTISTTANWLSFDKFRLTLVEPAISANATEAENSTFDASKDNWYALSIPVAGKYNITTTNGATITYSQDGTLLESEVTTTASNGDQLDLAIGTIYIKTSADASVTCDIDQIPDADATAIKESATALLEKKQQTSVKDALQSALDTFKETNNSANYKALQAAITNSEASINSYASAATVLAAMKELTESTNVYTADALKTYYTDPATKYEDGTLTSEEAVALQNPSTVTGWHAAITCDNFLLSAWDTNPDFNNAPYYINTWSVEGRDDGSEFEVPFFEYWTNDDKSLGTKTMTATLEGLEAGKYEVTALVRPRAKNGETSPKGIAFQVNDGDEVSVCDGTQIGTSQLFLKEVTAEGVVAADGKLTIKFNVSDSTNVSWLAFKNVKYTLKEKTINVVTENRAWDFTKGATYSDAIQADTENWKKNDEKGRWTNVNALDNAELQCGDAALEMTKGLTFTTNANKILIGLTANFFLQTTGATTITIPGVAAGDTIVINYCASGKTSTATITSDGWASTETCSIVGATKTEFKTLATKTGDVALALNNNVRMYTLEIRKEVKQDDTATGINAVEDATATPAKFIQNGKLVIVKNGKQYNAAGALLK